MNCEDCLLMLDEYVENELDETKAAQEIAAHLGGCRACASECEMLRRELQAYSQYLPGIEATPALRAKVRTAIEQAQKEQFSYWKRSFPPVRIFGKPALNPAFVGVPLVLLVIFAGIVGLIQFKSPESAADEQTFSQKADFQYSPENAIDDGDYEKLRDDEKSKISKPEENRTAAQTEMRRQKIIPRSGLIAKRRIIKMKPASGKSAIEQVIEKAEAQYKNAIAVLSSDIKRRRGRLAPNVISQLEQSLVEINRTIFETRRAVKAKPDDAVAIQYMTTAYAKKVELLRTVAGN